MGGVVSICRLQVWWTSMEICQMGGPNDLAEALPNQKDLLTTVNLLFFQLLSEIPQRIKPLAFAEDITQNKTTYLPIIS